VTRERNPNIDILELAVDQLGVLADEMVFLGGCATGLLITDLAAPPIRATKDVDAIVQIVSRVEYYQLADKLREKGFVEDTSDGAPICRWKSDTVLLDVMPTDSAILGFGNEWYVSAIENAEIVRLPSGKEIRLVSAPYFLITKLEAFDGRGNDDYLASHDIEDIVAVFDGRPELVNEVRQSEPELHKELSVRFQNLLREDRFVEAVSGHMPTDETSQARASIILKIIKELAETRF